MTSPDSTEKSGVLLWIVLLLGIGTIANALWILAGADALVYGPSRSRPRHGPFQSAFRA